MEILSKKKCDLSKRTCVANTLISRFGGNATTLLVTQRWCVGAIDFQNANETISIIALITGAFVCTILRWYTLRIQTAIIFHVAWRWHRFAVGQTIANESIWARAILNGLNTVPQANGVLCTKSSTAIAS